jgi:hypothetical protein
VPVIRTVSPAFIIDVSEGVVNEITGSEGPGYFLQEYRTSENRSPIAKIFKPITRSIFMDCKVENMFDEVINGSAFTGKDKFIVCWFDFKNIYLRLTKNGAWVKI